MLPLYLIEGADFAQLVGVNMINVIN